MGLADTLVSLRSTAASPAHKVNTRGSAWYGQLPPYKAFIDSFIHPSIHQAFTDCLQKAITGFVIDVRHSEQKQASPCPHRLYDLVGKIGIDQITTLYKKEQGPMSRQNQGAGKAALTKRCLSRDLKDEQEAV